MVKLILIAYLFINISSMTIIYMNIYEVKGARKLKYQIDIMLHEILLRGGHQQDFVQD